ncbi:MAG: alpha/beta hydrolase [Actinomycetota bacterium]|nr:alpha/beta hydrolase [Actinomycetota bacterium]
MQPEVLSQDIGEVELQYLHWPGEGPTVVMLHATGFLPWLWHPIARELAGNYRVIAPYFCDHRTSNPEEGGLSWLVIAEDLAAFMRRLSLEKPLVVGHSMGATVASIAEALHGPLAARMVLIEPIFLPSQFYSMELTVEQHPLASKSVRRRNRWKGEEEARDYLSGKPLFSRWDGEMLDLYLRHGMTVTGDGGLELSCHPRREAALFMGGMAVDPWELLENVACPVLLVEGGESENRLVVDLRRAAAVMPAAELVMVEGAGHLVPMEKPREVLSILKRFFGA